MANDRHINLGMAEEEDDSARTVEKNTDPGIPHANSHVIPQAAASTSLPTFVRKPEEDMNHKSRVAYHFMPHEVAEMQQQPLLPAIRRSQSSDAVMAAVRMQSVVCPANVIPRQAYLPTTRTMVPIVSPIMPMMRIMPPQMQSAVMFPVPYSYNTIHSTMPDPRMLAPGSGVSPIYYLQQPHVVASPPGVFPFCIPQSSVSRMVMPVYGCMEGAAGGVGVVDGAVVGGVGGGGVKRGRGGEPSDDWYSKRRVTLSIAGGGGGGGGGGQWDKPRRVSGGEWGVVIGWCHAHSTSTSTLFAGSL